MIPNVIKKWHQVVKTKNMDLLDDLLVENAKMYSPVVHTVQEGKQITKMYLACAAEVLADENFRYVREVYDDNFALLEFETQLDGILINGVDMISWDADERITDFKVMIRPLKAINMVHQAMGEAISKMKKV